MNRVIQSTERGPAHHSRFALPNEERFFSIVTTPVGELLVVSDGSSLVELHLPAGAPFEKTTRPYIRDDRLLKPVADELAAYFSGELTKFTVMLAPSGTEFQRAVWNALCEIEYGATATYGEVAAAINRPKAPRAVGMANHVNPIALIIPCHRVIGANGALTGYAGGLDLKKALLGHEASVVAGERPSWAAGDYPAA
ncbi:MAG TPA: methylated-DNA--[protein]-cysteine S-methyltransferase [Acidimicrobiales bacterium]|nr:methylated-DNA--[protein]-cysteine S-methyltransferase [Acidimicrobiales bacterium]